MALDDILTLMEIIKYLSELMVPVLAVSLFAISGSLYASIKEADHDVNSLTLNLYGKQFITAQLPGWFLQIIGFWVPFILVVFIFVITYPFGLPFFFVPYLWLFYVIEPFRKYNLRKKLLYFADHSGFTDKLNVKGIDNQLLWLANNEKLAWSISALKLERTDLSDFDFSQFKRFIEETDYRVKNTKNENIIYAYKRSE